MEPSTTFALLAWALGVGLGALLTPGIAFLRRLGKSRLIIINENNQRISDKWAKVAGRYPLLKLAGNKASPTLRGNYKYGYGQTSAFLMNAHTGHPVRLEADAFLGPSAYEAAVSLADNRSRNVQQSTREDSMAWAKIGALIGLVVGGLAIAMLVMIYRLTQAAGAAP